MREMSEKNERHIKYLATESDSQNDDAACDQKTHWMTEMRMNAYKNKTKQNERFAV